MFPACCFRQRTYMAQGLVNGIQVSLSTPSTRSCDICSLMKATSWKHTHI